MGGRALPPEGTPWLGATPSPRKSSRSARHDALPAVRFTPRSCARSRRLSVTSRDYGFQSDEYKGGKFSNQSSRKAGDKADGQEVRTLDIRNDRPQYLRKVVGEAVVLNVKEKTATIVITRTARRSTRATGSRSSNFFLTILIFSKREGVIAFSLRQSRPDNY